MDQEILNTILQTTYSLVNLKHRLRILQSYFLKAFFGETEATVNIPLSTQDSNWLKSLPESFYQKFTKDNVYEIFATLEQTNNFKILTIYLTFEPDDATLTQIGTLARQNFNLPNLLLDIKLDQNLIAGTALSWKGIYKDYSIRAKIEERRSELLKEFKKFLR